jgi:hypothetical protein
VTFHALLAALRRAHPGADHPANADDPWRRGWAGGGGAGAGQTERAARLLGAVEAARETLGMRRIAQKHHGERITADTRAALEAADFERAWSGGRVLTVEEAVAEALGIVDEVATGAG